MELLCGGKLQRGRWRRKIKPEIHEKTPHQRVGRETEKKVALGPAVGADLGGLAHLLLKLSTHTVVLLDAQRKWLRRFLRLQLRLVREKRKRKTMAFSYRLSFTNLKSNRIAQWVNENNVCPVITTTSFSIQSVHSKAIYSQSERRRAEQLPNVVFHNCQDRMNVIHLTSI